jgi:hypothetical protein
VPLRFSDLFAIIGGGSPLLGLLFDSALAARRVAVHAAPSFSSELGIVALALSVLSVFGAPGGFVLGIVGTSLRIAWRPAAE